MHYMDRILLATLATSWSEVLTANAESVQFYTFFSLETQKQIILGIWY